MSLSSSHRLILDSYFDALPATQWPAELNAAIKSLGFEEDFRSDELLSGAVARLLLASVQDELPDWEIRKPGIPEALDELNGERIPATPSRFVGMARDAIREQSINREYFAPQHILTINVATGAFGYSWPESYYVTKVDYRNRYVVTVSLDIGDDAVYIDMAIGHFPGDVDLRESIESFLIDRWKGDRESGADRWESVTRVGLIYEEYAYKMQEEVWGPEEDDDSE